LIAISDNKPGDMALNEIQSAINRAKVELIDNAPRKGAVD
jgi:hypothetical protein